MNEPIGKHITIDVENIEEVPRYDGQWVLRTNLTDEPKLIALAYMELWVVEDLSRTMKSILETRPIYHKRDETIRRHVSCSFLALLRRRAMEQRLEQKGESWERAKIVRGLDDLQEIEALFQGKRVVMRGQVLGHPLQLARHFRRNGSTLGYPLAEGPGFASVPIPRVGVGRVG